jgi:hypothetical protein
VNLRKAVTLRVVLAIGLIVGSTITALILVPIVFTPKPDFVISIRPDHILLQASRYNDGQNSSLITVSSLRNFTGIVSIEVAYPNGIAVQLYPSTTGAPQDKILLGKTGNLTMSVRAGAVGNYSVRIVATSGSISHSLIISAIVQNLTITASQGSLTIPRGSSGSAELTLTGANGLNGNLSLLAVARAPASNGYLVPDPNITAILTPSSIVLPQGGTVKVNLTINVAAQESTGERSVLVTAAKGSWNFRLWLQVIVV